MILLTAIELPAKHPDIKPSELYTRLMHIHLLLRLQKELNEAT